MQVTVVVLVIDDIIDGKFFHTGTEFLRVTAMPFKNTLTCQNPGSKKCNAAGLTEIKSLEYNAFGFYNHA